MRAGSEGIEFSMAWDMYDHTFNIWEPKLNVLDTSLVRSYMANQAITVNIEHALDELRELSYVRVAKMKSAEAEVEVSVPTAALGPVAHALLDRFSRVPSQAGKRPLVQQTKVRGGRVKTWLEIDGLGDIAWVLQMHLVRPDNAFGALVYKKGRTHATDMLFVGPRMTIQYAFVRSPLLRTTLTRALVLSPVRSGRYVEPKPRADGLFAKGHREFKLIFNVWKILGHNGDVVGEAGMPNATCKKPIAEHVKNVLRGRKAWGLEHPLQENWAQLPAGQLVLSNAAALPACAPKRARAEGPRASVKMAKLAWRGARRPSSGPQVDVRRPELLQRGPAHARRP